MTKKIKLCIYILYAAVVLFSSWQAVAQSTNNTTTLAQVRLNLKNNPEPTDRRLTRSVTRTLVDRDLFAACHASIPVEYYNGVTKWSLIICTDPLWNRIMYGDYNKWIKTYGSWGAGNGQFRHPHGIDRNAYGKIFIADTGNNRVVVLQINWAVSGSNTYNTSLSYLHAFGGGLSIPEDVAWDDNGTPTNTTDDYIWVADTGNHRIIRYKEISPGFYAGITYGTYGTGTGQFRHPKAIAVGRTSGVNDNNIYVADTGNQRIVRLNDGTSGITWLNSRAGNMVHYTSVESDWYGGVWVTDDFNHRIEKLDRYLNYLDAYGTYGMGQVYGSLNSPTDFSIYFSLEKIGGVDTWVGHDATFLSESWGDNSGGVCYEMGTNVKSITVDIYPCEPPTKSGEINKILRPEICPTYCTYFLTDYSKVSLMVRRLSDDLLIRTLFTNQTKAYGQYSEYWDGRDNQGSLVPYAQYFFRITATSLYSGASMRLRDSPSFWLKASAEPSQQENIPTVYALFPNYPNPFNPTTRIDYQIPIASHVKITIYDLLGRQITTLIDATKEAGAYRVLWDGHNERGDEVESGIYFYRMESGDFVASRKMALLR